MVDLDVNKYFESQYVVPITWIIEQSEILGKTNKTYNHYEVILKQAKVFEDEGLTPFVIYNSLTGGYNITSKEALEYKLN